MSTQHSSDDPLAYPDGIYVHTHPRRLAIAARLLGAPAADAEASRVLEIGCGRALNLLAIADVARKSSHVGIDLSLQAIGTAASLRRELELSNVELVAGDHALTPQVTFDYVIAHNVYSFMSTVEQARLLTTCARALADDGVLYVNFHPATSWQAYGIVRDAARWWVRGRAPSVERALDAHRFLVRLCGQVDSTFFPSTALPAQTLQGNFAAFLQAHRRGLAEQLDSMREILPALVHHEVLSDAFTPVNHSEFAEAVDAAGLRILGDADTADRSRLCTPEVRRAARELAKTPSEVSQFEDFLAGPMERQVLLVHKNKAHSAPTGDPLLGAHFLARDVAATELAPSDEPPTSILEVISRARPRSLSLPSIIAHCREAPALSELTDATITSEVRELFHLGSLEVYSAQETLCDALTDRPRARSCARALTRLGSLVPNAHHDCVALDTVQRRVLATLDGTRSARDVGRELGLDASFVATVLEAFRANALLDG